MSDEPVIIGNQNAGGATQTLAHFRSGAKNEIAEQILGSEQEARDWEKDGKRLGLRHWAKLFMVAPNGLISRAVFLSVILPLICAVFTINIDQVLAWEHRLRRRNDLASPIHWHIAAPYFDLATETVRRDWSHSHAKCERLSRVLEVLLKEPKVLLGRHQYSVVKTLRDLGEDKIADAIEAAYPPDAQPLNRTPARPVEQAAKKNGIEIREECAAVREAYLDSENMTEFATALDKSRLSVVASTRKGRPFWLICKDGKPVQSIGKCLAGTAGNAKIHAKLGEPTNDDKQLEEQLEPEQYVEPRDDVGGRSDGADPNSVQYAEVYPEDADVVEGLDGRVLRLHPEPEPHGGQGPGQVFVLRLLGGMKRNKTWLERLASECAILAQGAAVRIAAYLEYCEATASAFLATAENATPAVSTALANARGKVNEAKDAALKAWSRWHKLRNDVDDHAKKLRPPIWLISGRGDYDQKLENLATQRDKANEQREKAKNVESNAIKDAAPLEVERAAEEKRRDKKVEDARRWLRVVTRIRSMLKTKAADVAWLGPTALFRFGYDADKNAPLDAKWYDEHNSKDADELENLTSARPR